MNSEVTKTGYQQIYIIVDDKRKYFYDNIKINSFSRVKI